MRQIALVRRDRSVAIMRVYCRASVADELAKWPPASQAEFVEHHEAKDLPDWRYRGAWIWDGQKIVIDESRIQPKAAPVPPAPAGSVSAHDPRVDELARGMARQREEMAEAIGHLFHEMQQQILAQTEINAQRAHEALIVAAALHEDKPIASDMFPGLTAMLHQRGEDPTPAAIIAAADEITRSRIEAATRAA